MHPQFAELTPRWFKRAFVYTGSIGDFRYRFDMGKGHTAHGGLFRVLLRGGAGQAGERFPMGRGRCGRAEAVASGEIRSVFPPGKVWRTERAKEDRAQPCPLLFRGCPCRPQMMLRVTGLQVNLLVSGGGTPEDQGPAAAPDHQSRRQQRQLTG